MILDHETNSTEIKNNKFESKCKNISRNMLIFLMNNNTMSDNLLCQPNLLACSWDTSIGALKTIHITLSEHGGVVSDPWYVQ